MDDKLEQQIIDIMPYAFKYKGWDNITESLMRYGLSVGNGWYGILEELVKGIAALDKDKEVKVFQVKEKFGSLCFYLGSGNTDAIHALISKASAKSSVTCESCGGLSKIKSDGGWLTSICDKCLVELNTDDGK